MKEIVRELQGINSKVNFRTVVCRPIAQWFSDVSLSQVRCMTQGSAKIYKTFFKKNYATEAPFFSFFVSFACGGRQIVIYSLDIWKVAR